MNNQHAPSSLRAYLELVRLPNLFTAMADVTMGFLFTHTAFDTLDDREQWLLGLLVAASALLYAAGVVLNDVFDLEVDRRERPERPIPSGRVSLAAAQRLGWGLLVFGAGAACAVAVLGGALRPAIVGGALAGLIVLYDRFLKRTPLGPVAMGLCRMLNVLLGMSFQAGPWRLEHWLVAAAIGTYIVGVTWLARSEAQESNRGQLALAVAVILGGIALLALVPPLADLPLPNDMDPFRWYLLFVILGGLTAVRCLRPVLMPTPANVQMAVVHAIHTVVILDAVACFMVQGIPGAILVFLFLPPTMIAGRWIHST